MFYNGQQFAVGPRLSTMHPSWDVETYSEAGYVWNEADQKWRSPRGCGPSVRGLKAVGTFNYVTHPTFEFLSVAYDLLDGRGVRWWRPVFTEFGLADEPHDLVAHVRDGKILSAFNADFELDCWNLYAVPKYGWPIWHIGNARCDMAKAKAWALPGSLENVGEVLNIAEKKDKAGTALVRKLTVPKNPSAARKSPQQTLDLGPGIGELAEIELARAHGVRL
jgi:hypothetical protein